MRHEPTDRAAREANDEAPAFLADRLEVATLGYPRSASSKRSFNVAGTGRNCRSASLSGAISRQDLVGKSTVRGMDLHRRGLDRREPPRERPRSVFLSANDEPSWITMSLKRETATWPSGVRVCDAQPLDEPRKHLAHEGREAEAREAVVKRLVRDRDVVLMIELAQQIGEGFDVRARESRDDREKQPMGRDRAQPLGLAGVATELIHVVAGQRTRQGIPDIDKLGLTRWTMAAS